MKYIGLILFVLIIASCQHSPQKPGETAQAGNQSSTGNFGKPVPEGSAIAATDLAGMFTSVDTLACTVSGNISASCKHSGCWMDIDMGKKETVHVTFLDESFTIPLDAAGKNVVAQGTAIRELIPVEKLQNYAREDGKSEAEIAAITEPVYSYEFIATGVLIEE
jgi:hypothetical protein